MANLAGENRKSGQSPAVSSASASRREEKENLKLGARKSFFLIFRVFCLHAASPIHVKSPKIGSFWAHLCFPETAQKGKKKNPLNPNNVRTTDADIHQATTKNFFPSPGINSRRKGKDFFRRVTLVCCVVVAEIASKVFSRRPPKSFLSREKSRNKHLFYPRKLPRYF